MPPGTTRRRRGRRDAAGPLRACAAAHAARNVEGVEDSGDYAFVDDGRSCAPVARSTEVDHGYATDGEGKGCASGSSTVAGYDAAASGSLRCQGATLTVADPGRCDRDLLGDCAVAGAHAARIIGHCIGSRASASGMRPGCRPSRVGGHLHVAREDPDQQRDARPAGQLAGRRVQQAGGQTSSATPLARMTSGAPAPRPASAARRSPGGPGGRCRWRRRRRPATCVAGAAGAWLTLRLTLSEHHRREGRRSLEARPAVRRAARLVAGVDVERDHRGDLAQAHARPRSPCRPRRGPRRAAPGSTYTPWIWQALGRRARDLGLEHHPPVLDPGERPAAADQLVDPRAVEVGPPSGLGRDARPPRCTSPRTPGRARPAPPCVVRRTSGSRRAPAGGRRHQVRLVPPEVPRASAQCSATSSQNSAHRRVRTDDRGAAAVPGQGALGERPRASGVALTGTRFAPTWHIATSRRRRT